MVKYIVLCCFQVLLTPLAALHKDAACVGCGVAPAVG
jgi:hypothetical protein